MRRAGKTLAVFIIRLEGSGFRGRKRAIFVGG